MTELGFKKPVHLLFSQRNGYMPIPEPLQPEELSPQLRIELNAALMKARDDARICEGMGKTCYQKQKVADWYDVLHQYWILKLQRLYGYFNLPMCLEFINQIILFHSFHEVMDLVENLLALVGDQQPSFSIAISDALDRNQAPYILRKNKSGKWWIIPIGSSYEQEHVLSAFSSIQDPSLKHVRNELEEAGQELSKGNPIQSAEKSLKALEACARFVGNCPNKTGGEALKECNRIYPIPLPLYKSIEQLWAYRNDAPGVGHSMKDGAIPPPNRWDAQMVYGTCCVAISYLLNRKNT